MKRWNGWGEESVDYPLPDSAQAYLVGHLDEGLRLEDASLEQVLASVPLTRLPPHPLVVTHPMERLRHARGQSLPDWVALRSGNIGAFPDGVAYPDSEGDVGALLDYARSVGAKVIPYGGGTSVVGHITPLFGDAPVLTIDLSHMKRLLSLEKSGCLATFEAGITGPEIEEQLNEGGYTLGHFPQSFELSTLGGWLATRSCGQQSYFYGRIEDLFAGGRVITPGGVLELPLHPASAAGPDVRHLILGSEGRLGVITQATVRLSPLPDTESFFAAFFHNWEQGVSAVREIAQARIGVSMLRMSNATETTSILALSGKDSLVRWARSGLQALGYTDDRCMLIFGVTGTPRSARHAYRQASAVIRHHRGLLVGTMIGRLWRKSRFSAPYLRNTLWERGYALDTLETAAPWTVVQPLAEAVLSALQDGLEPEGERVLAFAHLSHLYPDGASLYFMFIYRRAFEPEGTLRRWQCLKRAASELIVKYGGTISHQHGVGLDHAQYLAAEKGSQGMHTLEAVCKSLDPDGMMNPGKLLIGQS